MIKSASVITADEEPYPSIIPASKGNLKWQNVRIAEKPPLSVITEVFRCVHRIEHFDLIYSVFLLWLMGERLKKSFVLGALRL